MSDQGGQVERPTLLAVFAHPDDESLAMGGTIARYAHAGVRVALLCATRGEWGTISDPGIATPGQLAEVRERELREACRVLGVGSVDFLDCPDGDVNNLYWPEVEERIVRHIRRLQPQVVVTFGPDGMYGHPDHIAVSYLTAASFRSAANPDCFVEHLKQGFAPHQADKLYYTQLPQNLARELIEELKREHPAAHLWELDADLFGVPEELITTIIEVEDYVGIKLEALRCHRSQLDENNAFRLVSLAKARRFLGREHFRLVGAETPAAAFESDLFGNLPAGACGGDTVKGGRI